MTPLEKGDYFLAKARKFQMPRFLKAALNQYESLPAQSADFQKAQAGKMTVVDYGRLLEPNIWGHL